VIKIIENKEFIEINVRKWDVVRARKSLLDFGEDARLIGHGKCHHSRN